MTEAVNISKPWIVDNTPDNLRSLGFPEEIIDDDHRRCDIGGARVQFRHVLIAVEKAGLPYITPATVEALIESVMMIGGLSADVQNAFRRFLDQIISQRTATKHTKNTLRFLIETLGNDLFQLSSLSIRLIYQIFSASSFLRNFGVIEESQILKSFKMFRV